MNTVIDFHVHGKITNSFPFDAGNFVSAIREAKNQGINCLALTEHAHSKNFTQAYEYLENNYCYNGEFYLVDGIKVFIGVEITTADGFDIICIDNQKRVLQLQKQCPDKTMTAANLFSLIDKEALVILAHPYRRKDEIELPKTVAKRIDAVELNAKDLFDKGTEINKAKVERLSKELNRPVIGGSDSHHFMQIGGIRTILKTQADSIKEIKNLIKQKEFAVEISGDLALRVRCAKAIKKAITGHDR